MAFFSIRLHLCKLSSKNNRPSRLTAFPHKKKTRLSNIYLYKLLLIVVNRWKVQYIKAPVNRAELKISIVLAILNNKHVQAVYLKGSRHVFLAKAFDSSVYILHFINIIVTR